MMIEIRKSEERGFSDHGWLKSRHTFSFADYQDPKHVHFRKLRVINEDWIEAGQGFGTHPHQDMEIITYVMSGALEHKDSMGNTSVITPGEIQRMSAGTGVTHSEFNHSQDKTTHLLQIWILPSLKNLQPSYEQKTFTRKQKLNALRLVASSDGRGGSVTIHQDMDLFASVLESHQEVKHDLSVDRYAWVQMVRGSTDLNGRILEAGDGAAIREEEILTFKSAEESEFLLFDLA